MVSHFKNIFSKAILFEVLVIITAAKHDRICDIGIKKNEITTILQFDFKYFLNTWETLERIGAETYLLIINKHVYDLKSLSYLFRN